MFVKCISVLAPFIVSFAFAYAFTPLVRWLNKKGLSKGFSIVIVLLGIILLVAGILAITLPLIYEQLSLLVKMIVEVMNNFDSKFDINLGNFEIKVTDYLNTMIKNIGPTASSTTMDLLNGSFNFIGKFIVGFVGFTTLFPFSTI